MKKIILLLAFAAIGLIANAQDYIVLKDATEIQAKVVSVSATEIGYHKWSNLNGPCYTIGKSDVLFIKYENGEKEVFNTTTPAATATTTAAAAPASTAKVYQNPRAGKVTFEGYFHGMAIARSGLAGPGIDVSVGARIYDYCFIGAEVGFDYLFLTNGLSGSYWTCPIGLALRGYVPTGSKVYPFGAFTIGAAVATGAGFHCQALGGVDIGKFTLSAGWDRIENMDSFVFKIGVRFGK